MAAVGLLSARSALPFAVPAGQGNASGIQPARDDCGAGRVPNLRRWRSAPGFARDSRPRRRPAGCEMCDRPQPDDPAQHGSVIRDEAEPAQNFVHPGDPRRRRYRRLQRAGLGRAKTPRWGRPAIRERRRVPKRASAANDRPLGRARSVRKACSSSAVTSSAVHMTEAVSAGWTAGDDAMMTSEYCAFVLFVIYRGDGSGRFRLAFLTRNGGRGWAGPGVASHGGQDNAVGAIPGRPPTQWCRSRCGAAGTPSLQSPGRAPPPSPAARPPTNTAPSPVQPQP